MYSGSESVFTSEVSEGNQNHRHFGTAALWIRQAELAEHVLADLEDFREGPESYNDDDQDLYHNGCQDQAVLHEVDAV